MHKPVSCDRAILACLTLLSGVALGHHSRFEFDDNEPAQVQGTIESISWRNPHIRFTVASVTETGDDVLWEIEGDPINTLERAGIEQGAIEVGERVTVLGLVSRRRAHAMLPIRVTREDGETLVLARDRAGVFDLLDAGEYRSQAIRPEESASAARAADGLFRVWTYTGRTQTRDSHPLTAAASAAKEAWDQPTDDLALRCVPAGMPEAMVSPFPIEFLQDGDDIVLRLEEWDNVRVLHMGNEESQENEPASHLGYSVGRWDGRDLVVRTTRIGYPFLDDQGTPQSEAVEIEERFTLSDDDTRLEWTATVVDPNTLLEPTTLPIVHWEWVAGEKIKPYDCVPDGQ